MRKRKIRILWLILAGIVLLLAAVYMLLPRITAGIAEHSLKKTLTEYGLEHSITWDAVRSTRWADQLEVRGLQIDDATWAPIELRMDNVVVKDYASDFTRADIALEAIQPLDADNAFGRFYYQDLLNPITDVLGVSQLPPQHAHLVWHYDQAHEALHVAMQADVPEAGKLTLSLNLDQPPSLHAVQAELMQPQVWLQGSAGIRAKLLEILWQLPLESLQLEYEDDGYFKHLDRVRRTPQGHAAAAYQDALDTCYMHLQALPEHESICQQIVATYRGEKAQLAIAIRSQQPVAAGRMLSALAGDPLAAEALDQLNIDVH